MKVCPKCGFKDNPLWKPLFWRLYWEYIPFDDFSRESTEKAFKVEGLLLSFKQILIHIDAKYFIGPYVKAFKKQYCEAGDFYYHFEDQFYYYRLSGPRSTRKLVYRFPKGYESMANRKLYEKTPSEKKRV